MQSADGFLFKLHRTVMMINSQMFADMLDISHESTDPGDSLDGMPVVVMTEKARVLKAVLPLLYNAT